MDYSESYNIVVQYTFMNLDIMLKQRIPTILDNLSECSPVNVFSPGLLYPILVVIPLCLIEMQ